MKRMSVWIVAALAGVWAGAAQAGPIELGVSGSTNAASASVSVNPPGTLATVLPSATLTTTTLLYPNNIGAGIGTEFAFTGDSRLLTENNPATIISPITMLQFSTPQGNFAFDAASVGLEPTDGQVPFTDAQYAMAYRGLIKYNGPNIGVDPGFDETLAIFAVFFNTDGSYGNAAFVLFTTRPTAVPEPGTLALCAMGLGGLACQFVRRRQAA